MLSAPSEPRTFSSPRTRQERLELARKLVQEFDALGFWHSPRDLEITEELIPFGIKGLRANGGQRGFQLAGMLRPDGRKREQDATNELPEGSCPLDRGESHA